MGLKSCAASVVPDQLAQSGQNCPVCYGHRELPCLLWSQRVALSAMVTESCPVCYGHRELPCLLWSQRVALSAIVTESCPVCYSHRELPCLL
ncbi:hypothetical protein DPMN_089868 [Dreissena polymorpha]|uniref:Uncharacterized protein n=1 Tax=Dreissena polymorpha TaxID=45954 RepID=A0A9D4QYH6_DREPO|nr:hypothetical protein DPMN_089868 [Dreissena polymorpha]